MFVDHIQLAIPAESEDKCRPFWLALGFVELDKPEVLRARGGAWFRNGSVEIHLGIETPFSPALKAHPGLATDEIDRVAGALAAIGAPVVWDDTIPNRRRFFTADPVGNRIEILETS